MRKILLIILLIPSICYGYNGNTSTAIWFQVDRTLRMDNFSAPYAQTSEATITVTAALIGYDFDAGDSIGWYVDNVLQDTDAVDNSTMQKTVSLNLQQDNDIIVVTYDNQGNKDTDSVTVTQVDMIGNTSTAIWFQMDYSAYSFDPGGLTKNEINADWATYYDIYPEYQTVNEMMGIIYNDEGIESKTFNELVLYINNLY